MSQGTLQLDAIVKNFGGLRVLNEVSMDAVAGRVTALIGPNGAGKSTLANIASGFLAPTAGRVLLDGADITSLPTHRRAPLGLGRTFQNLEGFTGLTVHENVSMGAYGAGRSGYLGSMLRLPRTRHEERAMSERADELLTEFGLDDFRNRPVESLAFGEAKLVEFARVLAMFPQVVVMDEPAAGLPPSEAMRMGGRIAQLAEDGYTVLLIEHNMRLVMEISHHIVVLDHGEEIARGAPEQIRANDRVIEAYLGTGAADDPGTPVL